jgi:hypothetical protein
MMFFATTPFLFPRERACLSRAGKQREQAALAAYLAQRPPAPLPAVPAPAPLRQSQRERRRGSASAEFNIL